MANMVPPPNQPYEWHDPPVTAQTYAGAPRNCVDRPPAPEPGACRFYLNSGVPVWSTLEGMPTVSEMTAAMMTGISVATEVTMTDEILGARGSALALFALTLIINFGAAPIVARSRSGAESN